MSPDAGLGLSGGAETCQGGDCGAGGLCSPCMSECVLGKGGELHMGVQVGKEVNSHKTWPHCTYLSNFSWGHLPLVGASEGTGDVPVEKGEKRHQCPSSPANRSTGDLLTHIPGEPTVNMKLRWRPSAG